MKNNLVLTGGRIVDPVTGYMGAGTINISGGKIAKVEKRKKSGGTGKNIIDLKGLLVCPGFIDMHVHLREPGREDEETIMSGSEAAAAGGFTSIVCMPNTEPPIDNVEALEYIIDRSMMAPVKVYPIGAVTVGRKGENLTEMLEMSGCGAVAFSDDGSGVQNSDLMRRALEYVRACDVPLISHCEFSDLAAGGVMNESYTSTQLGLTGMPSVAEELMVARDIMLAEFTQGRIHIAHVSTAGSVELIKKGKRARINVTAEATPHNFTLTDDLVKSYETNLKVSPPLRTRKDVDAVRKGLKDGTIDAIATDHAPHSVEEKELEFDYAPSGIIGLETAVGLVATELVGKKILTWLQAAHRLSTAPAKILNIPGGTFEEGAPADITIVDPSLEWEVDPDKFKSLSRNTPFAGWKLKGRPVMTIVDGNIAYSSL
jgi:dihydroorotase